MSWEICVTGRDISQTNKNVFTIIRAYAIVYKVKKPVFGDRITPTVA